MKTHHSSSPRKLFIALLAVVGGFLVQTVSAADDVKPAAARDAVPPLTWAMLVSRPELRPASCTVTKEFRFQGGVVIRPGTKVNVTDVEGGDLVVTTTDGRTTFVVKPAECDALAVAQATWSQLTPEQRALTVPALLRHPDLWPYRLKLTQSFEIGGRQVRAGDPVLFLGVEGSQLLVYLESGKVSFTIAPHETDLMAQGRALLAVDGGAPGRMLEELNGKLINPLDGRAVKLDAAARPKYVVLYRGASWCGPCQIFAPKLAAALKDKAPKPEDVTIIYLSDDRTPADMKGYVSKLGVEWPTLRYNNTAQLPAFSSLFGNAIPQLVVTDRHGKVIIDSAKGGYDRALAQLQQLL